MGQINMARDSAHLRTTEACMGVPLSVLQARYSFRAFSMSNQLALRPSLNFMLEK
jgi:hypothetical protein